LPQKFEALQIASGVAPEATNAPLTSLRGAEARALIAEFFDGNLPEAVQCFCSRLLRVVEYGIGAVPSNVIGNCLVSSGTPPLTFQDSDVLLQAIVCTRNGRCCVTMKQASRPGLGTLNDVLDGGCIVCEVRLQVYQVVEVVRHFLSYLDTRTSPPTLLCAGYVQNSSQAQYPILLAVEAQILCIPFVSPLCQYLNLFEQRMRMTFQTVIHRCVDLGQRFVDFQARQFEGCLPFSLQHRPDGGGIAFQDTVFANLRRAGGGNRRVLTLFLLNLGRLSCYLPLDLADATPPFFSSLARELSASRSGLCTALRKCT